MSIISHLLTLSYPEDNFFSLMNLLTSKIGKFRLSGEIHQWMYDKYSLGKLLKETGFKNIKVCNSFESSIPDFNKYHLDIEEDNSIRKPDSLFMEAIK